MKFFSYLVLFCFSAFAAPEKNEKPKATVFVEALKQTLLFDPLTYPARVNAKINATVLAESDGIVTKIFTLLGKSVSRGELLLYTKNTDPIYDYAPVRVTSPVKGVVSLVEPTVGSRVSRGQRLLTITDPSQVNVTIELASNDLSTIKAGQKAELYLADNAKPINLVVSGISPFVDPATGTATAELHTTEKTPLLLPPGSVGQVHFKARERQGIQVTDSAVVFRGKDPFVRIVEGEKVAKYLPVTLGPTRRGTVEILTGLKEGMDVIIRTSGFISDGEEVGVQKTEVKN